MNATDPFGLVGQVLDGQFRVDQLVGEGGFSAVYRGHHQGLNEPIAIKCLKLPAALGTTLVDTFVQRFRDESRILYRLSQGNLHIVRSIAAGTTQAPATGALVPYMVLEWLEGRSVQHDFTVRHTLGEKGRSIEEVVKLFDTAADGLAYAHTQGVVHRDLNPGNLFLANTQHGVKMKVLDFGVAKLMHDGPMNLGPRAQTVGQIKIFAPAYGAPEQFDDRIGAVSTASDVYSFALILLEALRDKTVVEGTHLGEFAQSTCNPERRPTPRMLGIDVPDEVEKAFERATTLDPLQRWRTAADFWQSLTIALKFATERKHENAARETPPLAMAGTPAPSPPSAPKDAAIGGKSNLNLNRTLALGSSTPAIAGIPRPAAGAAAGPPRPAGSRVPTTIGTPAPAVMRPPTPAPFKAQAPVAPLAPPVAPPRQTARPPAPAAGPSLPNVPPLAAPPAIAPPASAKSGGAPTSERLPSHASPSTARFPAAKADGAGIPESGPGSPANPRDLPPMVIERERAVDEEEDERTKVHAPTPEVLRTLALHDLTAARAQADAMKVAAQARAQGFASTVSASEADEAAGLAAAASAMSPPQAAPQHLRPPMTPIPPPLSGTMMMAPAAHAPAARPAAPSPPQGQAGGGATVAMMMPKTPTPGLGFTPPPPHYQSLQPQPQMGAPAEAQPQATEPMHMAHMQGMQQQQQHGMQPTPTPFGHGGMTPQQPQSQAPAGGPPYGMPPNQQTQGTYDQRPTMNQPLSPPSFAQQQAAGAPKSALPIIPIAIGLAVLALGGIGLGIFALRARHAGSTDPTGPIASELPSGAESLTPVPVPVDPVPAASVAIEIDAAPAVVEEVDAATTAPAASASASASATTTTSAPTATTSAPQFTWPPPTTAAASATAAPSAKPAADPNAFNEAAARSGLGRASGVLAFCKKEGGVTGPGNASVTFGIDGSVAGVAFDPPYAGTPEGNCVAGQFKRAKVSPFTGAPQTVRISFEVPK